MSTYHHPHHLIEYARAAGYKTLFDVDHETIVRAQVLLKVSTYKVGDATGVAVCSLFRGKLARNAVVIPLPTKKALEAARAPLVAWLIEAIKPGEDQ